MKTEDVRFNVLTVLSRLEPRKSLHRRQVANRVFGTDLVGAGDTYAALGYLRQRGWVQRLPWDWDLYRITDEGREQLAAQGPMRELIEEAS